MVTRMPNESLIAVPLDISNDKELRQFLVQLVLKLDELFGYRGDNPATTINSLSGVSETITTYVDESVSALKSEVPINQLEIPEITVAGPTVLETQEIADDHLATVHKVNELLSILRDTGIIT